MKKKNSKNIFKWNKKLFIGKVRYYIKYVLKFLYKLTEIGTHILLISSLSHSPSPIALWATKRKYS